MIAHNPATSAFATWTALSSWGFITSLVDLLVASVKTIFSLSNVEAQLSAFYFFIAYGALSLPAVLSLADCARFAPLSWLWR
jgi:MFS transporter, FHS family, L-fucose permease